MPDYYNGMSLIYQSEPSS